MSIPTIIIIIINSNNNNNHNNNNNNIGIPLFTLLIIGIINRVLIAVFIALVLVGPNKGQESQQAGGKPAGYLQAWSRI